MDSISTVKSMVAAALLVAGVSGVARADSDMNPLVGDSYAYFNGCNLGQSCARVYDKAPSTFRATNPNGLSERVLQSYSVWGEEFHLNKPVIDSARSEFASIRPHGLSERQMQALSTEAPAFQLPQQSVTSTLASTNAASFSIAATK